MNLGERIKKLRKDVDLTQQQFAERIGTTQNTMTRYETNIRTPPNAVITLICREFNVREEWLRDGEGEMFLAADEGLITQLAAEYSLDEKSRVLVANFLKLSDYERSVIVQASEIMAKKFAATQAEEQAALQKSSEATGDAVERQQTEIHELTADEAELLRQYRLEKNFPNVYSLALYRLGLSKANHRK